MRRPHITLAAALLVAAWATAAAAHDLFIKLDSYHLPPGAAVRVPIINGTFQVSENSLARERVGDASLVFKGDRHELAADLDYESKWATISFEIR